MCVLCCAVLGTVNRLNTLQAAAAAGDAVAAKQQSWQQARRNQEDVGGEPEELLETGCRATAAEPS